MKLEKLSNKTLVRHVEELRRLMDIAVAAWNDEDYHAAKEKYENALTEFRKRTERLGDFQRLDHS